MRGGFDTLQPERSPRKLHALDLFADLPRYDRVGALLSFGQDPRWRRAAVDAVGVSNSGRVLDVAAGTGLVAAELVRQYGCRVVGIDQSEEMLSHARRKLQRDPALAERVTLLRVEAERLPFGDGEFDALTVGYLFRYVDDLGATLRELARVIRPGGVISSFEFGVPASRVPRVLWRLYTSYGLPLFGGIVSRSWAEVGRFLARSIPDFYDRHPLAEQRRLWEEAGIESVQLRPMSFGAGLVISGTRS